jgi:hypothetical protein
MKERESSEPKPTERRACTSEREANISVDEESIVR